MTQPHLPGNATGLFTLAARDLPALQQTAQTLGQAFFHVDLREARNIPGILRSFKRDLSLPDWFGNNLDALNDCLTDFSWHPAPGYVIVLHCGEDLHSQPLRFAALNAVLASAVDAWSDRDIPFRIFYLLDAPRTTARP